MSKFVAADEYIVPSFQWLLGPTSSQVESFDSSVAGWIKRYEDESKRPESTVDGSCESFVLAVKPVMIGGQCEPAYDQAKWAETCLNVTNLASGLTGVRLIPLPEMARMIYLDEEDSFVDESEVDDWYPEDTSDGFEYLSADGSDYHQNSEPEEEVLDKSNGTLESEEARHETDVKSICSFRDIPVETTMGHRYLALSEEFASIEVDYQVSSIVTPLNKGSIYMTLDVHEETHPKSGIQDKASIERLEAAGHNALKTHAYFDDSYYEGFEESADFSSDFQRLKIKQSHVDWYKDPDKFFEPVLNFGASSRRVGSQKTVLTALKKRNADVPELSDVVDATEVPICLRQSYLNIYGADCLFESFNIMAKGLDYHKRWKSHKELQGVTLLCETNLQRYQHMIKSDVKPTVTDTLHVERDVPATITFHGKGVTSCFSPFFTACFEKFSLALRESIYVPIGKISSLELKSKALNNKFFLEADLSKFDKSQGELHLEFQRLILINLGFPVPLTNWWCDFHRSILSRWTLRPGVSIPLLSKTNRGCFHLLWEHFSDNAMMAYCFDMSTAELAMFSGDDSLVICGSKPEFDPGVFQSLFNMEVKVMDPSLPYICSKFLLESEFGDVFSVPDPMREIQRLQKRKIPKDVQVLRADFDSFCDRMKFLDRLSELSLSVLCRLTALKYCKPGIEGDVRAWLSGFAYYRENFLRYSECYVTDGIHCYRRVDPMSRFKPIDKFQRSDKEWFHDWRNNEFPKKPIDKMARMFGAYKGPVNNDRVERKAKYKVNAAMHDPFALAYERRYVQELELKNDKGNCSVLRE
ncbi:2a protein [Broad bean mottle virus]|uniref:RNA-directed RNA polymerase 2a n=1 Tax=Broad bean mottle virus TaxID=12301 RepID=RDRP_BBMV|nr:2a protein [Broad bean mottle virus]P27462.1 RecName: Full=RNA-directed RNA polymerase 2a; Short=protein 2a [Broad bean mottle virus]AAA42741.1 2a protein [Broad bean mottle virus]